MTQAIAGVGAKLYRQNPSTSAWEVYGEVNTISGPGMSRDTIDATSLASTGGYREFITGFRDGGEVTFDMNFIHADVVKLFEDFDSNTARHFKIVLPDTVLSTFSFDGLVTGIPHSIPPDDKVTVSVTIKVTGQTLFYSGASTTSTTT